MHHLWLRAAGNSKRIVKTEINMAIEHKEAFAARFLSSPVLNPKPTEPPPDNERFFYIKLSIAGLNNH